MKTKPDLKFNQLWNISFGFFGVQIAYALQSANISRIFATLGADPHNLSYFWILPPLMGMVVQPLVGYFSDKTWLGPPHPLPVDWSPCRSHRDVPVAQCRLIWPDDCRRHDLWSDCLDVP